MEDEELEEVKQEKENKGIRIGDKYILKADSLNLTLEEYGFKGLSPKDSKRARDEGITIEPTWGLIGLTYHRTLQQVLGYILDNNVIATIEEDIKELTDVVQVVENLRSEFERFKYCTKLVGESLKVIE
jgi:hypothetical protein